MRNSTNVRAAYWLVAAFVISFFAVGFPYSLRVKMGETLSCIEFTEQGEKGFSG